MKDITDGSVSLVLCDPPYSCTSNKWDKELPFDRLWDELHRVCSEDAVVCMFGTQPFTSRLILSNQDEWRYNWIWEKESPQGFLNANYAPLKKYEDICVFSKCTVGSLSKHPIRYFPQGVVAVNKEKKNNPNSKYRQIWGYPSTGNSLNSDKAYVQKYENYPTNILRFNRDKPQVHPTQKPVALLEYLIKTYTKEGEVVMDNCMGSGSTGVACANVNRDFIGIERDERYFNIAKERIEGKDEEHHV
jgi:site-specific DNA-methyltransferase (adenine-specific)